MKPKLRLQNRPLLSLGDVSSVDRRRRAAQALAEGESPAKLSVSKMVLFTMWMPAIVIHELVHYIVGRAIGVPITGVVLFQFSSVYLGATLVSGEDDYTYWQQQIIQAAPLVVCGPISIVALQWTLQTSHPAVTVLGALVTSGFVFCSVPDQIRTVTFRWLDELSQ